MTTAVTEKEPATHPERDRALPVAVEQRGISLSQWRTLFNLFPGGKPDSVLMVWDYCTSRGLDPMKKPCHIVPMRVRVNGEYEWRDVVMPGIYEYRITAQRTGLYLGHSEPEYGEDAEFLGVVAPKWCAMTFYRWNQKASERVPFPVKVWFAEVCGTSFDKQAKKDYVNDRWSRAPIQMLTKCTEAAGLREAFPEEFGGEPTAEEMEGRRLGDEAAAERALPKPTPRRSQADAPAVSVTIDVVPETASTNGGGAAPAAADERAAAPARQEPTSSPSTPAEPENTAIGKLIEVKERPGKEGGRPSFLVKNARGYIAATWSTTIAEACRAHVQSGVVVELVCKPARDPRYAPTIEEVLPVDGAQQ